MIERRYSGLVSPDMGDVITVNYTARDGQKIPAFVTLPPTIKSSAQLKNIPFIVLPHGGPYGRDEKRFDYFAQFFATRGYGVMQMNFRGSAGYGKSFKEAGRDNWIVMQEDVEDATRYLLSKGYADPNRTCIAGWSYGGYAALMGAAKDTDGLYDCVISMAGLTDIDDAKKDLEDYVGGRAAARTFFGDALKDSKVRKANSPVDVAGQIKVPVFLAHGDLDQNVRFSQFERMKRALEKVGADATYLTFENEDHFLSKQENRVDFFEGVEGFLNEVNGPSEYMAK
jgi:dipeptidyl aminopeptidase/acylaminoacyl peptidase